MKEVRHADRLIKVHPSLVKLVWEVAEYFPLVIICGERTKAEQDEAYYSGHSQLKWPSSKHNIVPPETVCFAVDFAPLPLNWKDRERMYYLGGFVRAKAQHLGINLRYGGDWDSDGDIHDEQLRDLVHYEIVEEW